MSTNQPGKPRIKLPGEDIDTTEAHIIRAGKVEDADTEGHAGRIRPEDESVNRDIDSTEGHVIKFRGVEAAGDGDSTEGHIIRGKP